MLGRVRQRLQPLLAAVIVVVLLVQLARLELPLDDYQAYWAASRLLLEGRDPYDVDALLALQRALGHDEELPQVMWNAPFALPLILPCGLVAYGASRVVWLVASLALVLAAVELLWRCYGQPRDRLVGLLAAAAFVPVVTTIKEGQVSPWQLVGLAGLLACARAGRWWVAGALLPLVAIKPHSVHLLWPALALWCVRTREWRLVAGAALSTGALLAVALAFDPQVLAHHRAALVVKGLHFLEVYPTATLASRLRLALGWEPTWPMVVVPALAWVWFAARAWARRHRPFDWASEVPLLVMVSLALAPYAWTHHLVFGLPAVLHAAALTRAAWPRRQAKLVLAGYALVTIAAVAMAVSSDDREVDLWWLASAYLGLYLLARRLAPEQDSTHA